MGRSTSVKKVHGTEHFVNRDSRFVRVTRELRESEAWTTLSPEQRWILIDWIEAYEAAIHYGERSIDRVGFPYTFSACKEHCARGTFHRAKEAITTRRFFTAPPEMQVAYAAKRYLPGDWRAWRMTTEQRRSFKARERIAEAQDLKRKRDFVDRISRRTVKTGVSK